MIATTPSQQFTHRTIDYRKVPSIVAKEAHEDVSGKYVFIPTTKVIALFEKRGWMVSSARQQYARTEKGYNYGRHEVRFRDGKIRTINKDDVFPEISLTNAHNGSWYYKMQGGLERLACANGLTVSEGTIAGVHLRHIGFTDTEVFDAIDRFVDQIPKLLDRVRTMQQIELNAKEQAEFSKKAYKLRFGKEKKFDPIELNIHRRVDDNKPTLWHTFNRVQENLLKGGTPYTLLKPTGRVRNTTTRSVSSLYLSQKLNTELWTLADTYIDKKNKL